jgi:Mg2+/Co2+ transporter CorC
MAGFEHPDARTSVDQIVRELAADFDDTPVDTIEQLVLGSFDELSQGARIETFLPVLTKRVVRERLRRHTSSAA